MKKTGIAACCPSDTDPIGLRHAPLTENNIAAAQLYGSQRKGASDLELVAPWTVYDRKQTNRYGVGEKRLCTRLILWQPSMPRVLRKMGELPQSAGA